MGLIRGGVKLRNGCFSDGPLAGMTSIGIIATLAIAQIRQEGIEMDAMGTEVTINYNACQLMPAEFMANKQIACVAWHSRKPPRPPIPGTPAWSVASRSSRYIPEDPVD